MEGAKGIPSIPEPKAWFRGFLESASLSTLIIINGFWFATVEIFSREVEVQRCQTKSVVTKEILDTVSTTVGMHAKGVLSPDMVMLVPVRLGYMHQLPLYKQ